MYKECSAFRIGVIFCFAYLPIQYPPLISDNPSPFLFVPYKPMTPHLIWSTSSISLSRLSSVWRVLQLYRQSFLCFHWLYNSLSGLNGQPHNHTEMLSLKQSPVLPFAFYSLSFTAIFCCCSSLFSVPPTCWLDELSACFFIRGSYR